MHQIRSAADYADLTANGNPWQDEFDDKVAEFVAALLVAGKTPQAAIEFL